MGETSGETLGETSLCSLPTPTRGYAMARRGGGRKNWTCRICGKANDHYASTCPQLTRDGQENKPDKRRRKKKKPTTTARSTRPPPSKRKSSRRKSAPATTPAASSPRRHSPVVITTIAPPVPIAHLRNADERADHVRHVAETRKSPAEVSAMNSHVAAHEGGVFWEDTLYTMDIYDTDMHDNTVEVPELRTQQPCLAILLSRLARSRNLPSRKPVYDFPSAVAPGYALRKDYVQDTTYSMYTGADADGTCRVRGAAYC